MLGNESDNDAKPKIPAITKIRIIRPIKEIITPAIAAPRGLLNKPIIEKTAPKSQMIEPIIGKQNRNQLITDKIKPAIPAELELLVC